MNKLNKFLAGFAMVGAVGCGAAAPKTVPDTPNVVAAAPEEQAVPSCSKVAVLFNIALRRAHEAGQSCEISCYEGEVQDACVAIRKFDRAALAGNDCRFNPRDEKYLARRRKDCAEVNFSTPQNSLPLKVENVGW